MSFTWKYRRIPILTVTCVLLNITLVVADMRARKFILSFLLLDNGHLRSICINVALLQRLAHLLQSLAVDRFNLCRILHNLRSVVWQRIRIILLRYLLQIKKRLLLVFQILLDINVRDWLWKFRVYILGDVLRNRTVLLVIIFIKRVIFIQAIDWFSTFGTLVQISGLTDFDVIIDFRKLLESQDVALGVEHFCKLKLVLIPLWRICLLLLNSVVFLWQRLNQYEIVNVSVQFLLLILLTLFLVKINF